MVGSIKGISYKEINKIYKSLPIYSKKDIKLSAIDITKILQREPGNYLSDILRDIEKKIVTLEIENDYDSLVSYVKNNY